MSKCNTCRFRCTLQGGIVMTCLSPEKIREIRNKISVGELHYSDDMMLWPKGLTPEWIDNCLMYEEASDDFLGLII